MRLRVFILSFIGFASSKSISTKKASNSLPSNGNASLGNAYFPAGLRAIEAVGTFGSESEVVSFPDLVHMWVAIIHDQWTHRPEPYETSMAFDTFVEGSTTFVTIAPGKRLTSQQLGYGLINALRSLFRGPTPTDVTIRVPTINIYRGRPRVRLAEVRSIIHVLPLPSSGSQLDFNTGHGPGTSIFNSRDRSSTIPFNQTSGKLGLDYFTIRISGQGRTLPMKDILALHTNMLLAKIWPEEWTTAVSERYTLDHVLEVKRGDYSMRINFLAFAQQEKIMTFGAIERVLRLMLTEPEVRNSHESLVALAFNARDETHPFVEPYLKVQIGLTRELPFLDGKTVLTVESDGSESLSTGKDFGGVRTAF